MEHHFFFQVQFWHHITKCTDCCFCVNSDELYCSQIIPLVHYKSSVILHDPLKTVHVNKKMFTGMIRNDHNHRYLNQPWYDDRADLCRTSIFDFPLYITIYLYHLFLYKDEKENRKL